MKKNLLLSVLVLGVVVFGIFQIGKVQSVRADDESRFQPLQLVANKVSLTDTTVTPTDTTVVQTNDSAEILALDVPPIRSSGFVLFTTTAVWNVGLTAGAPLRAGFTLRFNLTSPALPPGIVLGFGVPLTNFFRTNNGSGEGFEGGTAADVQVLNRKFFADFLLGENPNALTEATAAEIVDDLFRQGFHVSVSARLRSRNISDATVTNPNVALFAEHESSANP